MSALGKPYVYAAGGNFWQGFGTGVTEEGLNHLMHHDPPGKKLLKTEQGAFLDLETGNFYDAEGNFLYRLPEGGRIDQDYTLEGIFMPLAKAPLALRSALQVRTEAARATGEFIRDYIPSLNKGPGLRIGLSTSRGHQVFRVTYGQRHNHWFDIDLGSIPRIKP